MRNLLLALTLLAAAAAEAEAQDLLKFKEGKGTDIPCDVVGLNYKTIEYEIEAGTRVKQTTDAKNVQDIVIDPNHKTFDFVSGETALNNGDFDLAVERFERVRKDTRASDLLKQTAAINVVRCYWLGDKVPAALAAIKSLRQERPDSFYVRESYEHEIRCHLARGDVNGASGAVAELENRGKTDNIPEWSKTADVMRGGFFELQKKWREALAIHRKYIRDKDVGDEATLGELRCLAVTGDWAGLNTRADSVISELKGKKNPSARVLTGAFNARGEANLNAGRLKEALLDFMQGVAVLNKSGGTTREHETSLGRGALACARIAAGEKDKTKKETYKHRAQELLSDLDKFYPNSPLRAEALKAVQDVK